MDERNANSAAARENYARQLAQLAARVPDMTPEQREKNAEKIAELERRVQALPDELYEVYARELYAISGQEAPQRSAAPAEAYSEPAGKKQKRRRKRDYEEEDDDDEEEEDPEVARRRHRAGLGCLITLIVLMLTPFLLAGGAYLWGKAEIAGPRGDAVVQTIEIQKGASLQGISDQLEEAGIIRSSQLFRLYARSKSNMDKIQYGEFELSSDMSYDQILAKLQEVKPRETTRVTFPEGKTTIQYAQILEKAGVCSAEAFLEAANSGDFSQFKFWDKLSDDENIFMRAEGYLFPDTYEFYLEDDAYNVAAKLFGEFDNKFTDEMYARMEELEMTLPEVITLASLVQEEAGNDYSKTVSAVFHNRLAQGMTLGSNVAWNKERADDNNYLYDTVAGPYGFGEWEKIPEEMREAYDTYDHDGLPVGPVSNPGLLAIEATLWPEEDCAYFYFQTDTLGNYHFAKTNWEHEQITAKLEAEGIRP